MNGEQITSLLKRDPVTRQCFTDIVPANHLPHKLLPGLYVVNTDPDTEPGTHWVVFYQPSKGPSEFFDSFANPPQYYHKQWKSDTYNLKVLQASDSNTCGLYCVYFALHRCRGKTMKKTLEVFGKDKDWNDHYVKHFVNEHYKSL
jgi:hypothetical protein